MKVIIAGGRDFDDYEVLSSYCDQVLSSVGKVEIVSGGARGADRLAEIYARERGHKLTVMNADWYQYGKAAGHIRNREMAEYADALIAFWDGNSPGTSNMISTAKEIGLKVRVKRYGNEDT